MTRLKKVKRNTLLRAKNESKDSPLLNAFVRQAGCLCFVYDVQKLSVKRKERREFCKTRSEFKGTVEAVRKEPDDRSVADRHHKRAPVQADQFPKKAEGHDRACKQVREHAARRLSRADSKKLRGLDNIEEVCYTVVVQIREQEDNRVTGFHSIKQKFGNA